MLPIFFLFFFFFLCCFLYCLPFIGELKIINRQFRLIIERLARWAGRERHWPLYTVTCTCNCYICMRRTLIGRLYILASDPVYAAWRVWSRPVLADWRPPTRRHAAGTQQNNIWHPADEVDRCMSLPRPPPRTETRWHSALIPKAGHLGSVQSISQSINQNTFV